MADIRSRIRQLYSLEELAFSDSPVHRLHPGVKLAATFIYIVLVVSFNRYKLGRLLPFIFYPMVLMPLSSTPWAPVLKRTLIALPFVLAAGLSNVILDRQAAFYLGAFPVSYGLLSFLSLIYKTFLCVTAALLLVSVTSVSALAGQLRRAHVPELFVSLFEMTYRYIGVLLEEASTMYTAYRLRSTDKERSGLKMKHLGSFLGQLLIRSFDRAERIYAAMKCRGYSQQGGLRAKKGVPLRRADYIFMLTAVLPFVLLRVFDFTELYLRLFLR
jgi:cobalt/nickel transport system permease protein